MGREGKGEEGCMELEGREIRRRGRGEGVVE
jgi:hypothetical protein